MTTAEFASWKQRIAELSHRNSIHRLFGSELHRFQISPCLTGSELGELESAYGISVPTEYRNYLLNFGNGGAGPGYGVVPFGPPAEPKTTSAATISFQLKDDTGQLIQAGRTPDIGVRYDPNRRANTRNAALPFPLTAPFRAITDEMLATPFQQASDQLKAENAANKQAFEALRFGQGILKLADYGSGIYAVLILNGPFAEQVWITDPHAGEYVPASFRPDLHNTRMRPPEARKHERKPTTFVPWFESWLDASESLQA